MKKLVKSLVIVFGMIGIYACTPDTIVENEHEIEATDKGDVSAPGVEDEEDSND